MCRRFVVADHPVPAKTNPLGVKGCGEAGCAGSLTSVMNAVIDALAESRHPPYRHAVDPVPHLAGAARAARRRALPINDASDFAPGSSASGESDGWSGPSAPRISSVIIT